MLRLQFFILITGVSLMGCNASTRAGKTAGDLGAADLKPYGRTALDTSRGLELIGSASNFGFSFEGAACKIYVSVNSPSAHNYIQYEIDGIYQKRIKVSGASSDPVIITASSNRRHQVWIYKATEAHTGPVFVSRIEGSRVRPLERPAAPMIEFIGNSITCGAAADPSETPCGTGVYHDQHNAYQAYGPRVARALNTNFMLSSVSGIGVYRNWNSDGPAMPEVYEKTDFQAAGKRSWDFANYSPRVVSIALGTNDFSNGDGKRTRLPFDSAIFVSRYISFIRMVVLKYPSARIALLSSPMSSGAARIKLQNCLDAVKSVVDASHITGKPLALHFFEPMKAHGCSGHPDVGDHAILARELVPFFKALL